MYTHDGRERVWQSGPWDPTILCHDCESRYQLIDKRATEAMRIEPVPGLPNGLSLLPGADAATLKLYFMHLLWRAHESKLPDMVGTDLREVGRTRRLRQLLLAGDPGGPKDFAVHLCQFQKDPQGLDGIIRAPERSAWKANRASSYEIVLGRWLAIITVGAGGPPAEFRDYALVPGKPVPVAVGMAFAEAPFFREILDSMRQPGLTGAVKPPPGSR